MAAKQPGTTPGAAWKCALAYYQLKGKLGLNMNVLSAVNILLLRKKPDSLFGYDSYFFKYKLHKPNMMHIAALTIDSNLFVIAQSNGLQY